MSVVRDEGADVTDAPWNRGGYDRCNAYALGPRCRRRAAHTGLHVAWARGRGTTRWDALIELNAYVQQGVLSTRWYRRLWRHFMYGERSA